MSFLLLGVGGVDGQGFNLLNGLVADWPFDEPSGTRIDVVNNLEFIEVLDPVSAIPGVIDNGILVDQSAYLDCTVDPSVQFNSSTPFTFEFWIKDYPSVESAIIFTNEDSSLLIFVNGDFGLSFSAFGTVAFFTESDTLQGQWSQYVVTYDGLELTTFANTETLGSLFVTTPYTGPYSQLLFQPDNGSAEFDNFRMWNRVLSTEEIVFLYNNGASRSYSELGG